MPNKSAPEDINKLLQDDDIPTAMGQSRMASGGLHYTDKECWACFATIEYIYSNLATSDNFLGRGGRLLCEICDDIVHNNELQK